MSWLTSIFPSTAPVTPAVTPAVTPSVTDDVTAVVAADTPDVFAAAFALLLKYEGGYGVDPRDSGDWTGGACNVGQLLGTKYGVDSATYAGTVAQLPESERALMPATVKDLTIEEAGEIYRLRYWSVTRCPEMPPALALVTFDSGVNSGTGHAVRWLQAAVGTTVDGGFGPATMSAVEAAVAAQGAVAVASRMLDERLSFLQGLSTWATYGHGWGNRIADLRNHIGSFPL